MKKITIYLLITSMINLIGCYYQEQMTPSSYNFDEQEDIQLTTKDTTYSLNGKDYAFKNDTLFTTVSKKIDRLTTLKTNVEIPIEIIKTVDVERTNMGGTLLLTTGILIGVLTLVFFLGTDVSLNGIKAPGENGGI